MSEKKTATKSTSKRASSAKKSGTNGSSAERKTSSTATSPSSVRRPDNDTLLEWYTMMHLGRLLDDKAANYLKQAKGWSYHAPCSGHEGIQLALGKSFRGGQDYLFPYYRDLMTSLAAGISPYEIILNGLSKDADVAGGGRHMSNHFAKPEIHIQNGSSCTGNQAPQAAGLAKAVQYYKTDAVVFCSSGESATAEGYYYEAVNGATTGKYPVIFVIQNNHYGISVPIEEVNANPRVSDNFRGFSNLKIINCDGTDVVDSWNAMQEAIEFVKSGEGCAMVHAQCVRIGSHSNSDRHELYRSEEELESVRKQDPVAKLRALLIEEKIATDEELTVIEKQNRKEMLAAADQAEAMPDPAPESYADFLIPDPYNATEKRSDEGETVTILQAINTTLKEEFRSNPDTFMWGQDMATKEKGGIFNVSKGMQQEFGWERVHNSPIAEDYIVGSANGFSRYGDNIRVVIEGAEFADYFWPAMEQTVEMGHEYWRTKGQFSPNVTIRLASGGFITGGLYHSQTIEATLQTLPGMRIVYPSFADDAAGLLRTCMRSRGMAVFLEPKFLYNHPWGKTSVPENFEVPFGSARYRREGSDLTIITYGNATHYALKAAERLAEEKGINAAVLDMRSIKPLDEEAICEAAKRTGRILVAHEDHLLGGVGGEIASIITEECFRWLDAPVMRVGSKNTPIGFSPVLEKAILISADDIFEKASQLSAY
ncbi:MAG: 2-oxoisovalerate dehydrogenase [Ignavibacteriae bacterium]|nr:2-oxoisovalerate dehydrogenase [Ignavibacteriota bacterium]MCB9217070.1 2-oxoisovalerate dehydrogenase [Ignavibacteria bacterium]